MGEISVKTGNNARNGGKNSLNRLIRCVCGKKIGPDPRNFNQRVSLGRNDLLIRTFLSYKKKHRYPLYSQDDRVKIISSMRCVDEVFIEESLEDKARYIEMKKADLLVMGDDWEGRFDWVKPWCEVIYLPRTPSISTTEIIEIARLR
ncbi:hypothetical protein ACRARH_19990 [Phytobacter ursingii]